VLVCAAEVPTVAVLPAAAGVLVPGMLAWVGAMGLTAPLVFVASVPTLGDGVLSAIGDIVGVGNVSTGIPAAASSCAASEFALAVSLNVSSTLKATSAGTAGLSCNGPITVAASSLVVYSAFAISVRCSPLVAFMLSTAPLMW
jgi:hypothetical protein